MTVRQVNLDDLDRLLLLLEAVGVREYVPAVNLPTTLGIVTAYRDPRRYEQTMYDDRLLARQTSDTTDHESTGDMNSFMRRAATS